MNRFPFTQLGFFEFQQYLHLLSDESLQAESEAIQHNFNTWINVHFEIPIQQQSYLESIDEGIIQILALDTSFAVTNRLPISLKEAVLDQGDKKAAKTVGVAGSIQKLAVYEGTGKLEINIGSLK